MTSICTFDPIRHVAWRWELACRAVELRHRPPPELEEPAVAAAIRLQRRLKRPVGSGFSIPPELQPLYQAYQLYSAVGERRWEIEARLLARQSDHDIGIRCGVPPEVIESYERLFFAVRDRLGAQDFIMLYAVGLRFGDKVTEQDLGVLWRHTGYTGGPSVLDAMIPALREIQRHGTGILRTAHLTEDDPIRLATKIDLAVQLFPSGLDSIELLAAMLHRYRGLRAQKAAAAGVAAVMAQPVNAHQRRDEVAAAPVMQVGAG